VTQRRVIRTAADKAVSADDYSIVSNYLALFWKVEVDITGFAQRLGQITNILWKCAESMYVGTTETNQNYFHRMLKAD
jgi:hypothetical protein